VGLLPFSPAPCWPACASVEIPTTVDVTGMPNAELALQKSMTEVDAEIGRIGQCNRESQASSPPDIVPENLSGGQFRVEGPLDGAIESLAKTIGYTVAIRAPSNAQPLMIAVSKGPRRVYDILHQIGEDCWQPGPR